MEETNEGDCIVSVNAQVMTRDESTQGWLPLAGGGMAAVSVRKRPRVLPDEAYEFIIYGKRVSDDTVILSCVIDRNLEYNKVMPTFHHWRAGKQRNGLTFQTAADARAFDKGVLSAFNQLIEDIDCNTKRVVMYRFDGIDEHEDFMALDLPQESNTSRSPPDNGKPPSTVPPTKPLHTIHQQKHQLHLQRTYGGDPLSTTLKNKHPIHTITLDKVAGGSGHQYMPASQFSVSQHDLPACIAEQPLAGDNYTYVQIGTFGDCLSPLANKGAAPQTSADPTTDAKMSPTFYDERAMSIQRGSIELIKKAGLPGLDKDLEKMKIRRRCRYCHELYFEDWNKKGSCGYAPDRFRNCIEKVSWLKCARCMVYHCMSDAEGESVQNVCSCTSSIGESGGAETGGGAAPSSNCKKRWFGLVLLSIFLPCLCCYPPLRACHWTCVKCGLCGGRHKPQQH